MIEISVIAAYERFDQIIVLSLPSHSSFVLQQNHARLFVVKSFRCDRNGFFVFLYLLCATCFSL